MTATHAAIFATIVALPSLAFADIVLVEPGDNLSAAFRGLGPGDELVFSPQEFDLGQGLDVAIDGLEGSPIVVRGAGAVLTAPDGAFTLRIEGTHFVVQDLEIRGPETALTLVGEDILVRDAVFTDATNGIVCEDCALTLIEGCEFIGMTDADGAAVLSEAFISSSVNGNWVHDVAGEGIVLVGRTTDAQVADNVVELAEGNGIRVELPELQADLFNSVVGNYVGDVGGTGIMSTGAVAIVLNIVTAFAEDGIQSTLGITETGTVVSNNTVVGETTCFRGTEWSLASAANDLANNALYCDDTAIIFDDGVSMLTQVVGNVYSGAADFPGESVSGEGLADFVDAENRDFYPASGSPLLSAGVLAFATGIDYNGVTRDARPDAGAYERDGDENPGAIPGGGFKGAIDSGGGDDAGGPGPGEGTSGSSMAGGTDDFPGRGTDCNCSSASAPEPLFPLLTLLGLFLLRRRR